MKRERSVGTFIGIFAIVGALAVVPAKARAHCDTLDGPVVKAAREALQKNEVDRVLIWVKTADEAAVREAFRHTLAVRKLGPDAKELADRWFFETLVRLHRTGEGAPYTGLKPAGLDMGPAIPASDKALESGDIAPLIDLLTEAVRHSLEDSFQAARAARSYAPGDVAAGRKYIAAYVPFIHKAEAIHRAAAGSAEGHFEEEASGAEVHHGER